MKQPIFASVVVLAALASTPVIGMPGGAGETQRYAFDGASITRPDALYDGGPKNWSVGLSWEDQKRDMVYGSSSGPRTKWDVRYMEVFLGYDVFSWLTLQGAVGDSGLRQDAGGGRDGDTDWAGGLQVRLLDYTMLEDNPWPYQCRLDGQAMYRDAGADIGGSHVDWDETFAALTLGLTAKPESEFFARTIGVYIGPAYSAIDGKTSGFFSQKVKQDQSTGYIAGLTVTPNDFLTFKLEMQKFNEMGWGVSLGLHF